MLQIARIVAYSLNRMTREMGLANLAIHWNGDDPEQIMAGSMQLVQIINNNHLIGEASLEERYGDTLVSIAIPDCHDLIRAEHLHLFDPSDYGIIHRTGYNPVTIDKHTDLFIDKWVLDKPIIDMGPRQIPIRRQHRGKLKVTSRSGKVSYS